MGACIQVVLIAIGLAMDAFSVSIVTGLKTQKVKLAQALRIGICFGAFQALMPLIGFVVGDAIQDKVDSFSGVVAFALLAIVGGKMIYESQKENDDKSDNQDMTLKVLLGLGIATSIDALVVGTTLNLVDVPIGISVAMIGIITLVISACGYMFGTRLGKIFGDRVEILGGVVLIGIGISFLFY